MKELHLFYAPDLPAAPSLPQDEAVHAVRVLRMHEGDELACTDGRGTFYQTRIVEATPKRLRVEVEQTQTWQKPWQGNVCIAVAPTKNLDRMEWFAEKATEIGVDRISLLRTDFGLRREVKTERLQRILVGAMKQSHKALLPTLEPMTDFARFIAQPFNGDRFIAHCYDDRSVSGSDTPEGYSDRPFLSDVLQAGRNALLLVGPEGDFSLDEVRAAIAAGFRPVSLGESRLRTETAALVGVHLMHLAARRRA